MSTLSHRDILYFLSALGYKETDQGHCHGIGNIILQSFFVEGGFDNCLKRMNKIAEILQKSRGIFQALNREQLDEHFFGIIKACVDKLPDDDKYDLYAFCDSIKIVQSPEKYPEYFSKKKITQDDLLNTLNLVLSAALEKKEKTLNIHSSISGIYSEPELTEWLRTLREQLDASGSRSATVVYVSHASAYDESGHATGFAYVPAEQCWYFVDSNSLPPKKIAGDGDQEELLANMIFCACDNFKGWMAPEKRNKKKDFNSVALSFSIRNVASSEEEAKVQKDTIAAWKKSSTYKRLHEFTSEKISKKDKYGNSWLDMAEGEDRQNILLRKFTVGSVIRDILIGCGLGASISFLITLMMSGGAITAANFTMASFCAAVLLSPVGIGLMVGISLLLITLPLLPFIYEKIAASSSKLSSQSQNANEMTSEETPPKVEKNSTQQIVAVLKNTFDHDDGEFLSEGKDSCIAQKASSDGDTIIKIPAENDNLSENHLPPMIVASEGEMMHQDTQLPSMGCS